MAQSNTSAGQLPVPYWCGEMAGVVHSEHARVAVRNLKLVQAAWALGQPPIGTGRLIQHMQQYCPINAVVPNEDNCFVVMTF
jgi:hypothetical protein